VKTHEAAEDFFSQYFVHCVICGSRDVDWLHTYRTDLGFQRMVWSLSITNDRRRLAEVLSLGNMDVFSSEKDFIAALQVLYNSLGEFKKEEANTLVTERLDRSSDIFRDVKRKMEHNWDSTYSPSPEVGTIQLHNHAVLDPVLETFESDRMKRVRLWLALPRERYNDALRSGLNMTDAKNLDFGNGIYLTSCPSKALYYVANEVGSDNTVLLLCDVALGSRYQAKRKNDDFEAKHRSGYNSVVALANSRLVKHDQYVVFDPARVVIRFTINF